MPAAQWPIQHERPEIQVIISVFGGGHGVLRRLVADTGAGNRQSVFELVLLEHDCLQCGGIPMGQVQLGGAYSGWFPLYLVEVRIPQLNFDEPVPVIGVAFVPQGFDGIAGFRFLNRFNYGNHGNPDAFGLDRFAPP
jgi:hypothetical protein